MKEFQKEPLVSIIVPVYNVERYLNKCVQSIVEQTYRNIEILLVDDGSPDACSKMCEDWKNRDSRIQVFHKKNGGQGSARNLALDHARGEFLAFVDSDDYIDADMIEVMMQDVLEKHADLAICGLHVNNGIRVADVGKLGKAKIYENAQELLKDYISTAWIFTGPVNKLYSKALFDGIRFPEIRCNEDAYIMHELLGRCKRAVHTNRCLYTQCLREGSTEKSAFSERNMVLIECARRLREYVEENCPELYQLVVFKPAEDTVSLMRKIVCRHSYSKNKTIYKRLEKELDKEIAVLEWKSNDNERLKKMKFILNFRSLSLIHFEIRGYRDDLKKTIKYGLIELKNRINEKDSR